jgi:hypothetical protein
MSIRIWNLENSIASKFWWHWFRSIECVCVFFSCSLELGFFNLDNSLSRILIYCNFSLTVSIRNGLNFAKILVIVLSHNLQVMRYWSIKRILFFFYFVMYFQPHILKCFSLNNNIVKSFIYITGSLDIFIAWNSVKLTFGPTFWLMKYSY